MTGAAVALVLVSAFAHASWNLIAKRANTPELTNWWMAATSGLMMTPAAIVLLVLDVPTPTGWLFIGGTIILHVLYFFTLGRAYRYGDLSIVYPVARGLGLSLIPVLGVLLLNEGVSAVAGLGMALILIGIIAIGVSSGSGQAGRPGRLRLDRGLLFAMATGVLIGSYSVLDKRGVEHVTPVLYMYFLTAGGSLGSLALIHRSYSRLQFTAEFRRHWRAIVIGGGLQFSAYALVLTALRFSQVSYVGPFRELAIGIGVVLGAVVLKERVTRMRIAGTGAIGAGALIIAFAP